MEFVYNKTAIGYSHINNNIVCQDYSESYINNKIKIVTCCDGHGGKLYIRSDKGAKLASKAVIDVITKYSERKLESLINSKGLEKIKLEVLCKWNALVEEDYSNNHFTEEELKDLDKEQIFKLENNYITAYGTTLNAAILTKKYLIAIQIGDGGLYFIKNKKMELTFPENDDNVANITNSLCGDKAYNNLFIKAVLRHKYKGVILCTDGLLGPYQTYNNFYENFVNPFIQNFKVITKDIINEMDKFIDSLGCSIGIGDDVSFSTILYMD